MMQADDLFKCGPDHTVLRNFREGRIRFDPTYKYKPGSTTYSKTHTPAWCDRVLYKAGNFK